jgi:flavorubredoxin
MTRRLTEEVHWLSNCREEAGRHLHMSEYLIEGEDGTVLVDSGSSLYQDEIVDEIDRLTDGAGPDAILLTHSTLPHTENVPALTDRWGEITTVSATGRYPEIVGLPDAEPRQLNRPIEYGGREFTCIHPILTDVTVSQWIFDHRSRVLFTAEAFGHYHAPDDCAATSAELDGGIDYRDVEDFYLDTLPFARFLDRRKLESAFESLFDVLDVSYVAPIHGTPIAAEDVDDYVEDVVRAVDVERATP